MDEDDRILTICGVLSLIALLSIGAYLNWQDRRLEGDKVQTSAEEKEASDQKEELAFKEPHRFDNLSADQILLEEKAVGTLLYHISLGKQYLPEVSQGKYTSPYDVRNAFVCSREDINTFLANPEIPEKWKLAIEQIVDDGYVPNWDYYEIIHEKANNIREQDNPATPLTEDEKILLEEKAVGLLLYYTSLGRVYFPEVSRGHYTSRTDVQNSFVCYRYTAKNFLVDPEIPAEYKKVVNRLKLKLENLQDIKSYYKIIHEKARKIRAKDKPEVSLTEDEKILLEEKAIGILLYYISLGKVYLPEVSQGEYTNRSEVQNSFVRYRYDKDTYIADPHISYEAKDIVEDLLNEGVLKEDPEEILSYFKTIRKKAKEIRKKQENRGNNTKVNGELIISQHQAQISVKKVRRENKRRAASYRIKNNYHQRIC